MGYGAAAATTGKQRKRVGKETTGRSSTTSPLFLQHGRPFRPPNQRRFKREYEQELGTFRERRRRQPGGRRGRSLVARARGATANTHRHNPAQHHRTSPPSLPASSSPPNVALPHPLHLLVLPSPLPSVYAGDGGWERERNKPRPKTKDTKMKENPQNAPKIIQHPIQRAHLPLAHARAAAVERDLVRDVVGLDDLGGPAPGAVGGVSIVSRRREGGGTREEGKTRKKDGESLPHTSGATAGGQREGVSRQRAHSGGRQREEALPLVSSAPQHHTPRCRSPLLSSTTPQTSPPGKTQTRT
jgi:hypothetical protein